MRLLGEIIIWTIIYTYIVVMVALCGYLVLVGLGVVEWDPDGDWD